MNFDLDGKVVDLQYKSPLALVQARKDVSTVSEWLNLVAAMGPDAATVVNAREAAVWLGNTLNVPASLISELSKEEADAGSQL